METSIIVAIITGLCAVLGQWLIARQNKAKTDTERAVKDALMEQRLDRIEAKLDEQQETLREHNGYAQKFADTAERLARVEQKLDDL